MDHKVSQAKEGDLRWTVAFSRRAHREGWGLFVTGVGQSEIQKLDASKKFGSDAEAVYFAYQQALQHKRHARAAFTLSLGSLKRRRHGSGRGHQQLRE